MSIGFPLLNIPNCQSVVNLSLYGIFLYLHDSYITKFDFMNYFLANLVVTWSTLMSAPWKVQCLNFIYVKFQLSRKDWFEPCRKPQGRGPKSCMYLKPSSVQNGMQNVSYVLTLDFFFFFFFFGGGGGGYLEHFQLIVTYQPGRHFRL